MRYPPTPRKFPLLTSIGFFFERPMVLILGLVFGINSLFATIFAISLSVLTTSINYEQPDFKLISEKGVEVEGIIENKDVVITTMINQEHPIKITYTYEVDGIQKKDSIETMSLMTVEDWKVGDKVKVKHYKGDSIIPKAEPVNLSFDFPFMAVIFVFLTVSIVGFSLFGWVVAGGLKKRYLYINGEVRIGEIFSISLVADSTMYSLKNRLKICYAFESHKGEKFYGESVSSDLAFFNEKKKGDEVSILVSPVNERVNCVVDESIMRKAIGIGVTR